MKHPDPQVLIDYQEERLEREATDRVREHLATCDWCLDDIEDNLREKLRADLDRLDGLDKRTPDDALANELRRNNHRLADEPIYREETCKMLSEFGMANDDVLGSQLRLLNDFDERLAKLKSERR